MSNTNNAKRRYNSSNYSRVVSVGFDIFEYENLELISPLLKGNYFSRGTINVNNSTVQSNNTLILKSDTEIILSPSFEAKEGSNIECYIED